MRSLLERIDDALNPIVVKELRQAVQSRFVVAVLLLFLLIQLVAMGIFLIVNGISGQFYSTEYQAGSDVFMVLQVILLTTCMLFIPAYTALRLAAERSEVNIDLFFISALRPRSIIWGKFVAALILALLIFSACTPFMTFTYFLRGIDIPSIFFVITLDYLVVATTVMLSVFLSVVPANRVFKSLLGVLGLLALVWAFAMTMAGSIALLQLGLAGLMENKEFWLACLGVGFGFVGFIGLFFTWSVALLSPPSANRAVPMRLWVILLWLAGGAVAILSSHETGDEPPFFMWLIIIGTLLSLCLVIGINEREQWAPRVARTIPRRWWLRPFALLTYSGAAGGIILPCLLFGLMALTVPLVRDTIVPIRIFHTPGRDELQVVFETMSMMFLYTYCYAMTAVFLRRYLLRQIQAVYTWLLFVMLLALGSAMPFLLAFLFLQGEFHFGSHYKWLLPNAGAAMAAVGDRSFSYREDFFLFIFTWAGIITLLCLPWFLKQIGRFRPYVGSGISPKDVPPVVKVASTMEATRVEPT